MGWSQLVLFCLELLPSSRGVYTQVSHPWLLLTDDFSFLQTGDRTFEEMDYLFENRVPARKFRSYVIDETHGLPSMAKKADPDD